MRVLFGFNAQFCGKTEQVVELPDNTKEDTIKETFPDIIGITYDDNCYFDILDEYVQDDESPCNDCGVSDYCDGWEAQFCCTLCQYEGREHCEDCDPMDI